MTCIIFGEDNCGRIQEFSVTGLLIGSLAITVSQGILGSPAPDRLIADTLNSYAAPSKTSFTAYFVSVGKRKKWLSYQYICSLM